MLIKLLKNYGFLIFFIVMYLALYPLIALDKQKKAEVTKLKQEHQQQILMLQRQAEVYQQQQQLLIDKVSEMQQAAQQQEKAINEALESNKNWSDERVPDDVSRLLNNRNKTN